MIGCTLTVTVAGVEHSVVLRASDIVAFERQYNVPWQLLTSPQGREEWELWVAWSALKRSGVAVREFDDFLDTLESPVRLTPPAPKVGVSPLAPPPSPEPSPESTSEPD